MFNVWWWLIHWHDLSQGSEDKGEEEESQIKMIPKWKATDITAIQMEPEIEEEEVEEAPPAETAEEGQYL